MNSLSLAKHVLRTGCVLGLLLVAIGAQAQVVAGDVAAPVVSAPTTRPVVTDAELAWKSFLATGDRLKVAESNNVLLALYGETGLSADSCRGQFEAIDRALVDNPVGISLWNVGYECAKLVDDEELANSYFGPLVVLATYAMGQASEALEAEPIAVSVFNDIYALLQVAGLQMRYGYIDPRQLGQHYAIQVAAWDEETKTERHLSFDFLQPLSQLGPISPLSGYPALRPILRRAYLEQQTKDGTLMGVDLSAVIASNGADNARDKVGQLRDASIAGGVVSGEVWLDLCIDDPFPECGAGLVDALLPFAEEHFVEHTVNLALAYSLGIGVKRDEDNAMALLDAAASEAGSSRPVLQYARHFGATQSNKAFSRDLKKRLQRLADDGDLEAAWLLAQHEIRVSPAETLTRRQVKTVTALAERGYVHAYGTLANYYRQRGQMAESVAWLRKAAEAGDADAELNLGWTLLRGRGIAKDPVAAEVWLRKAADDGKVDAMMYQGWMAMRHEQWPAAEAWYQSAVQFGSTDGAIALANLYAEDHPGVAQNLAVAARIFDSLVTNPSKDAAKVRREYATLLVRDTSIKNTLHAIELLQTDAVGGDVASQLQLATGFLDGRFGVVDEGRGNAWRDKLLASEDKQSRNDYAYWLYYKGGKPESRQQAVDHWKELVDDGFEGALNNLAWVRCTSPDAAIRNRRDGLRVAELMGDVDQLAPAVVDTVAACFAANGQFDRAVELEAKVIADWGFVAEERESEQHNKLEARLALYRDRHEYTEEDEK